MAAGDDCAGGVCGKLVRHQAQLFQCGIVSVAHRSAGRTGCWRCLCMVRKLGQIGENKTYIVFFFSAFSCVVTLPYLLLAYEPMTWKQLLILVMAGLSAAGGQFGITSAYCYAPAKDISVYDYTQILFAAGLGFLLFAQIPDWMSLAGYLIIITMGVLMFLYQRRDGEKEKSA